MGTETTKISDFQTSDDASEIEKFFNKIFDILTGSKVISVKTHIVEEKLLDNSYTEKIDNFPHNLSNNFT